MNPRDLSLQPDEPLALSPDGGGAGSLPMDGAAEAHLGTRERILLMAREQYFKLGFARVTVDETASALGISKKTLYQHFTSKDELVRAVCEHHQQEIDAGLKLIHQDKALSPRQKLKAQTAYIAAIYRKMSPSLIHDLQRIQPEIWKSVEEHRQCCMETDFVTLIREGKEHGTFRRDIDERLFLKLYMAAHEALLQPAALTELPFRPEEVYETISRILFEGFLTDKARMEYHEET